MARIDSTEDTDLLVAVARYPDGAGISDLTSALPVPRRTLQAKLRTLVRRGLLERLGAGPNTRYKSTDTDTIAVDSMSSVVLTSGAREVREYVQRPLAGRRPVGYDRGFLDAYRPNVTAYLDPDVRQTLAGLGARAEDDRAAGTFARRILDRLLIDLSWSSSRLEGNTYSLLDTEELLRTGRHAEGKAAFEAQMILNHKAAIEFLVEGAMDIAFDRYTVQGLHALLADNLLGDPAAGGRIRTIPVRIEGSAFHPLEVPQLVDELFQQVLDTAAAIENPFEQSFFVLVHLPYLQPFDDVNKRVSRLTANIPLIKRNLCPLSFLDVPTDLYVEAILGVYELCRVDLLRDLYVWAYRRSSEVYSAVRRSLGDPDPFRLEYRAQIRDVVARVVRAALSPAETEAQIRAFVDAEVPEADRAQLVQVVRVELEALHEGNIARYRLRPSEYAAWREVIRTDP